MTDDITEEDLALQAQWGDRRPLALGLINWLAIIAVLLTGWALMPVSLERPAPGDRVFRIAVCAVMLLVATAMGASAALRELDKGNETRSLLYLSVLFIFRGIIDLLFNLVYWSEDWVELPRDDGDLVFILLWFPMTAQLVLVAWCWFESLRR